jgi:hypothetical protein
MPMLRLVGHNSFNAFGLDSKKICANISFTIEHLARKPRVFSFTTLDCGVLPKMRDFREVAIGLHFPPWFEVIFCLQKTPMPRLWKQVSNLLSNTPASWELAATPFRAVEMRGALGT